jgi:hypothetical protein
VSVFVSLGKCCILCNVMLIYSKFPSSELYLQKSSKISLSVASLLTGQHGNLKKCTNIIPDTAMIVWKAYWESGDR